MRIFKPCNARAPQQLSLFDSTEFLHRAVDGVRKRYGYDPLHIAMAEHSRRCNWKLDCHFLPLIYDDCP